MIVLKHREFDFKQIFSPIIASSSTLFLVYVVLRMIHQLWWARGHRTVQNKLLQLQVIENDAVANETENTRISRTTYRSVYDLLFVFRPFLVHTKPTNLFIMRIIANTFCICLNNFYSYLGWFI